jgi:hypothetical protein
MKTLTIKFFNLFVPDRMSQLIVQEVCIRLKQLTVSWLLAAVGMCWMVVAVDVLMLLLC